MVFRKNPPDTKALRTLGWRNTSITTAPGPSLALSHAGMLFALPAAEPLGLFAPVVSMPVATGMPTAFMFKVSVAISVSQSCIKQACS
mgnify:CR=1 FL=1